MLGLVGAHLDKWLQLLVTGITVGSIYSLIALGYVTIYRTSRIVNMAQGAFVMFGAFFTYSFLSEIGLPYWLSAILAIVAVVIVALVMYLLVLRPLIKISLVSIILATMALSILFENVALLKWGGYGKSVPAFTGDQALFIGKVAIFPQSLWVIGLMILVLVGLYLLTSRTRMGKQMTATANDPGAASLSGVNTGRMILLAFAISAAIGALGGIAITPINSTSYLSGGIFASQRFCGRHPGRLGIEQRCRGGRPCSRHHPVAHHRVPARRLSGRHRLCRPHPHPVLPAQRHSRSTFGRR